MSKTKSQQTRVQTYLAEHPDSTAVEAAKALKISQATVHRWKPRNGRAKRNGKRKTQMQHVMEHLINVQTACTVIGPIQVKRFVDAAVETSKKGE